MICTPAMLDEDPNASCTCPEGTVYMRDKNRCVDKSTMCGPGTQWVDADNACVPLQKYMSQAQIAAATRAGVLPGTTPSRPAYRAPAVPAGPTPSKYASAWVIGGIAVAGVVFAAALASKQA